MKRHAMMVCLLMAAMSVCAQTPTKDSLRVINLNEVEVISTRATSTTPVAFTNVSKEQLKKQNFGQDIPYLLTFTPSVLTTSDAGAGIGYTSIRVRGTDATRINVTTNGIPMNDAESHSIYWVNTPDFASSLQDMQIQRGAGTSTNGAGAFGASINMQTQGISPQPYAEFSGSYGSFNTHKETVKVGTGIINNLQRPCQCRFEVLLRTRRILQRQYHYQIHYLRWKRRDLPCLGRTGEESFAGTPQI